jgi:hypothetical protein
VADFIHEGIIIVQEGRVQFVNSLIDKVFSVALEVDSFLEKMNQRSIIENIELLDIPVFKGEIIDNDRLLIDSEEDIDLDPLSGDNISVKNSVYEAHSPTYTLRDIMLMPNKVLEDLKFTFINNDMPKFRKQLK